MPSDARDHVVPVVMLPGARRYDSGIFTTACRRCNGHLGSAYHDTLAKRCAAAHRGIEGDYDEDHTAEWEDRELKGLGYSLRKYIRRRLEIKKLAEKRISWQSGWEFQTLWDAAYSQAKEERPHNLRLHAFLNPAWLLAEPAEKILPPLHLLCSAAESPEHSPAKNLTAGAKGCARSTSTAVKRNTPLAELIWQATHDEDYIRSICGVNGYEYAQQPGQPPVNVLEPSVS